MQRTTGCAANTGARTPTAEATTAGTSRVAGPGRSPSRPNHHRKKVAAEAWISSAVAARLPEAPGKVRGTNVMTMPAAIATTKKTTIGPQRAGVRRVTTTPTGRPGRLARPDRPGIAARPTSGARPPAAKGTPTATP